MFKTSTPPALEVDVDWDMEMAWDAEVDAIALSTSELLALLTDMPPNSFVCTCWRGSTGVGCRMWRR